LALNTSYGYGGIATVDSFRFESSVHSGNWVRYWSAPAGPSI
jgi:hypothetical protein